LWSNGAKKKPTDRSPSDPWSGEQPIWYLGEIISGNLKWTNHKNKTCIKVNSTLIFNLKPCPWYLIYTHNNVSIIIRVCKYGHERKFTYTRVHCNINLKETVYISLVQSMLDFSSTVCHPHLNKDIVRLESIQRCPARFSSNDNLDAPAVSLPQWKTLDESHFKKKKI